MMGFAPLYPSYALRALFNPAYVLLGIDLLSQTEICRHLCRI